MHILQIPTILVLDKVMDKYIVYTSLNNKIILSSPGPQNLLHGSWLANSPSFSPRLHEESEKVADTGQDPYLPFSFPWSPSPLLSRVFVTWLSGRRYVTPPRRPSNKVQFLRARNIIGLSFA